MLKKTTSIHYNGITILKIRHKFSRKAMLIWKLCGIRLKLTSAF
uniref:Uncharacterized protein n=1 Tax=Lepeophtheirus salmonis TaxID=72036 RepID=A0A0K2UY19_LEPSM